MYLKEYRIEFFENVDLNADYEVFKKHKPAKQVTKHVCKQYIFLMQMITRKYATVKVFIFPNMLSLTFQASVMFCMCSHCMKAGLKGEG